jgi:hypothetical protein
VLESFIYGRFRDSTDFGTQVASTSCLAKSNCCQAEKIRFWMFPIKKHPDQEVIMAKKFGKKLTFRTSTIAQLNGINMNGIVGGKYGCTIEDSGCTQDSMRGEVTCTQPSLPTNCVCNTNVAETCSASFEIRRL